MIKKKIFEKMYDGITVSVTGLATNSRSWSVVDLPGNLYEGKASEKKRVGGKECRI